VLMGKHKPIYNPSGTFSFFPSLCIYAQFSSATVDCGDYVVVTNCLDVKVTGRKEEQLVYRKHTMFPGGLKEMPYRDMMIKKPEEARLHLSVFFSLL